MKRWMDGWMKAERQNKGKKNKGKKERSKKKKKRRKRWMERSVMISNIL